jgi:hypothetical protein
MSAFPGTRGIGRTLALAALAVLALNACGSSTTTTATPKRVMLIVMENHTPAEALQGAFTAGLAAQNGVATNYHAITHPSVPNYLALTSGQTWGIQDDSYHALPRTDLGDQLTAAGINWRAYMEGLGSGGCLGSPLPYDPGHNPFAFYGGACPSNVVPATGLASDLSSAAVQLYWIGPDLCHDQHSCPVSTGDDWLKQTVGMITASRAWTDGGVLFITWDEDDGKGDNSVLTLVVRPGVGHRVSTVAYNHYSLLATIEDILGVPRLANAVSAPPMRDLAG